MDSSQLALAPGRWLVVNCGQVPSEKNCKLVLMAPEAQREDLLDAAVAHAVGSHGHENSPELRSGISQILETLEV